MWNNDGKVYNKIKHGRDNVVCGEGDGGGGASFDVSTRQFRLSNNINARSGRGVGEPKKKK